MNRNYISRSERECNRKEMAKLRGEGKTLDEIAKTFNTCRQNVTYLIGKTGNVRRVLTEAIVRKTDFSQLTRDEVEQMPGVKSILVSALETIHHKSFRDGSLEEEIASGLLNELGIQNTLMCLSHPFDILTKNGNRIDVKHANGPTKKYLYSKSPYPSFRMGKLKGGKDCDYFLAMIPDKHEKCGYATFVIPANLSPMGINSAIQIPWPPQSNKPSKWHQFKDRFDLLK